MSKNCFKPYTERNTIQNNAFPVYFCTQSNHSKPFDNFHIHPYSEILIITEGSIFFQAERKIFEMQKGDLVLIAPCLVHDISVPRNAEKNIIHFHRNLFERYIIQQKEKNNILNISNNGYYIYRRKSGIKEIDDILKYAMQRLPQWYRCPDRSLAKQNTAAFLGELILLLFQFRRHLPHKHFPNNEMNKFDSIIWEILQYIEQNVTKSIDLQFIASQFDFEYSAISRYFKKKTGYCFKDYLNNLRVQMAETLISTSDAPLTEIAFSCGFNSQSYFIEVFRKHKGMSPGEYRKKTSS